MHTDHFKETLKNRVALVDFNADWCAPCRAQKPVLDNLKEKYRDRADVIEINIDENRELATSYMVQSIPTIILFRDGREIKRFVGLQTGETIERSLESAL